MIKEMKGVVTSDWHLRNQPPKISMDKDWFKVQEEMVDKIINICIERKLDLYHTGDLYHSTRDTTFRLVTLVQRAAQRLSEHGLRFYLFCGNHDLYGHSSEYVSQCAIGVILNSPNIIHMNQSPVACGNFDEETPNERIIAKHVLCFPDLDSIPPNCNAKVAPELLMDYDKAEFIFLGDNHHHFHYERKCRHVINPGCTTIQALDMIGYETGVYVVDTENKSVEWVPVKVEQSFYNKNEIEPDVDLETFANSIEIKDVSFDFESNVMNSLPSQEEDVQNKVKDWLS